VSARQPEPCLQRCRPDIDVAQGTECTAMCDSRKDGSIREERMQLCNDMLRTAVDGKPVGDDGGVK